MPEDNNSNNNGTGTPVVPPFWMAKPSALKYDVESVDTRVVSMGWHPDLPDFRDKQLNDKDIKDRLKNAKSLIPGKAAIPAKCDHRQNCSPIEDQGKLGSCTAQAVVSLMEYMMRRSSDDHVDGSRLFTYKVTRNLLGWVGDRGAYLRSAMQSVAAFGVPPEKHWPYDIKRFDEEPTAFLYSFADNYKALNYTRLDPIGMSPTRVLTSLKRVLAAGYCTVFGFTVYSSLSGKADIPVPTKADSVRGGHAVMAVGYDDEHLTDEGKKIPSLIIRNSWGTSWGEKGYGYLPYEYVLKGLAIDFWTAFKWDWIDSKKFE
jgi:C1A family cysteine protease